MKQNDLIVELFTLQAQTLKTLQEAIKTLQETLETLREQVNRNSTYIPYTPPLTSPTPYTPPSPYTPWGGTITYTNSSGPSFKITYDELGNPTLSAASEGKC